MILFPAIDLKNGVCVRLLRGDLNRATVFNLSPTDQARQFVNAGCQWLHVVDLNGAFSGCPKNLPAVEKILAAVHVPVQLGGGIRDIDTIASYLEKGVRRVVLGTVALYEPTLVKTACRLFPDQIAVGIDTNSGLIAVRGWTEKIHHLTALELALRFEDAGVAAIICTDISRDGTLSGPNITGSVTLSEKIRTPMIVSGGVSCLEDLKAVHSASKQSPGIVGVIVGRALYERTLDLQSALKECSA